MEEKAIRPTKKQKELLDFIEEFQAQHGYSPSYREVRDGLKYNSVSVVALHVNNLINRGHLLKRGHSARSLEVAKPSDLQTPKVVPKQINAAQEKWLVEKIGIFFKEVEDKAKASEADIDKLQVLIGALKVLGGEGAANAFSARLSKLKARAGDQEYLA